MQVPEKLSLIGGSILLASTLTFTLKSQASNILPKVDSGMSAMFKSDQERQQDQQKQQAQAFDNNFQQAQQKSWQTGQWGSSKYYIDNDNNMHVGTGQLSGSINRAVGDQAFFQLKSVSLDASIQAPQNSQFLFGSGNNRNVINQINGLDKLDTSQATNMYGMFSYNYGLSNLDLSHFDTHNVTNMSAMFASDNSLSNLDLSHFDTSNVNNMNEMFYSDGSLSNLDVSNFNTHNVTNMNDMFLEANTRQLSLGSNTKLQNNSNSSNYDTYLSGTYQSNGQMLNLDGNAHPGTWVRQ